MSHFIIDCDPGHDDAVAILTAARHLDLVGVTTVFGNSSVANTTRNALAILDAAGLGHIPVAAGAAGPMEGELHSGEIVHGKTGLDGANLPASARSPVDTDAPDFIIEMAKQYDDLVIIAVAPETNVAEALLRDPELADRVTRLAIMGGSIDIGNATPAAEFNILADPEAASIVFRSGIPITMAGLNVTTSFGITSADVAQLTASDSLVAREIGGALAYYLARQADLYGRDFAPLHDVCAVAPFINPGLVTHEDLHVAVECTGELTRGMTVCDRRGVVAKEGIEPAKPPNAGVAVAADGTAIVSLVLDTLTRFP